MASDANPLHEKLTVKLEKTDYLPSFEKALKEYSKKANIPGFRKGMVPAGLIKKMYGSSLFTDEVLRSVDRELIGYIWHPGFSTAESVTDISGRGVGMDIVKSRIEALSGTVDIRTTPGQGTTFRVTFPALAASPPPGAPERPKPARGVMPTGS